MSKRPPRCESPTARSSAPIAASMSLAVVLTTTMPAYRVGGVLHSVGEIGVESDECASLRGACGDQNLIGRHGETLNFGGGYVVPCIVEKPAPACTKTDI
jgi:hypothetical protein